MTISIVFEHGPETKTDVLVNVWCDGRRAGTLAFSKEVWAELEQRGGIEVFVGSRLDHDYPWVGTE
jgi:hypothetical protein